jgi:hypothetical protein
MSYGPCGYECEGCPVQRANTHHIYKQETARQLGGITLQFCHLEQNKVQLCQPMHQTLEAEYGWPDYPTIEVMKAVIEASHGEAGLV